MKIVWVAGLPEEVRVNGTGGVLCPQKCAAWGWVLGHLPPPQGIELHIVCPVRSLVQPTIHFCYEGAQWHCFREMRGEQYLFRLPVLIRIRKYIKELRADVVSGWGGETGCGWIATWSSKRAFVNVQGVLRMLRANEKATRITPSRGRWLDWKMRELVEYWTYRRAWRMFAESNESQAALKRFYGYDCQVVFQPLRNAFLKPLTSRVRSVGGGKTFLFVGEMVRRKGPMDVLHAFLELKNRSTQLIMVGSGPLESEAREFVLRNGLQTRVKFLKEIQVDEVVSIMSMSDFFILPSYGDTGPTSLKEALSQGLYPICYDNTGPKELIGRYGFGSLGKTGDWMGLVSLMDAACDRCEELRTKGLEVATRVKSDLSPVTIWPKILNAYQEVIRA